MKRLVFVLLLLLIVSPIIIYGEWIVGGYPWVKNQMEMEVRAHLASRGYKPADIQDVKADYNRKLSGYTTKVIFRDEKNSIYYYDYIGGNIVQTGLTTSDRDNAKHIEKDSFLPSPEGGDAGSNEEIRRRVGWQRSDWRKRDAPDTTTTICLQKKCLF